MNSITLYASHGYQAPSKPYIARLTGLDQKFLFAREFLSARQTSSRSGRTSEISMVVTDPGIYEATSTTARGKESQYYIVLVVEGELMANRVSREAVIALFKTGRPVTELNAVRNDENRDRMVLVDAHGNFMWKKPASPRMSPAEALDKLREMLGEMPATERPSLQEALDVLAEVVNASARE